MKLRLTMTIDDDPIVPRIIEAALGIESRGFTSGQAFLAQAASYSAPLAVFVDINLGMNDCGLDLLPKVRDLWTYTPVFVITANPDEQAIGHALAGGANDFIRKPLRREELVARYLARASEMLERSDRDLLSFGDIVIDRRLHRLVNVKGKERHLSASEIELLVFLAQAQGAIIERGELKRRFWGNVKVSENALDKKLFQIRSALADVSNTIKLHAVYKKGIRLTTPLVVDQKIAS